jgi:hypothetical protein
VNFKLIIWRVITVKGLQVEIGLVGLLKIKKIMILIIKLIIEISIRRRLNLKASKDKIQHLFG